MLNVEKSTQLHFTVERIRNLQGNHLNSWVQVYQVHVVIYWEAKEDCCGTQCMSFYPSLSEKIILLLCTCNCDTVNTALWAAADLTCIRNIRGRQLCIRILLRSKTTSGNLQELMFICSFSELLNICCVLFSVQISQSSLLSRLQDIQIIEKLDKPSTAEWSAIVKPSQLHCALAVSAESYFNAHYQGYAKDINDE